MQPSYEMNKMSAYLQSKAKSADMCMHTSLRGVPRFVQNKAWPPAFPALFFLSSHWAVSIEKVWIRDELILIFDH